MADKKSRLAEIYKAEKSKGGGIASTLGKRALEKVDPRQFFNQKGFMAAALPSLFKTYSATPGVSGRKLSQVSSEIGQTKDNRATSFSTGALETKLDSLTGETRELKIHSKIAAKNSESLPIMARDMNLMRQNITKLVKLQGGTAASRADMFFMKSGERESAYENRFIKEGGKSKTPTQVDAKPKEEKKGIFATIMEGLSSIFSMKGALIAGILAVLTLGIKEYFSNDEFKGKVDALVSDMFSTIKGFLIEYWKEVAIGLALLFPSATMALISSGISILSSGISLLSTAITTLAPLLADGLTLAVRGLITLLSGPAGLILLLGGGLFLLKELFDKYNSEANTKEKKDQRIADDRGSQSSKVAARTILIDKDLRNLATSESYTDDDVSAYTRGEIKTKKELQDRIAEADASGKKAIEIKSSRVVEEARQAQQETANKIADRMDAEIGAPEPSPLPRYNPAADSQAANTPAPTTSPTKSSSTGAYRGQRSDTAPTKSSTTPITTGSGGAAFGMYPKPGGIQSDLMAAFAQEGITDEKTQIALLANIKKESGFKPISENLNYTSTARLKEVFPSRTKDLSDEQLKQYTNNPQGLAELVYGGKMGNTEPGDGFKYRGRGFIQLTGKNNYASMGAALNLPLVDNPDLANDPIVAARIAARYIKDAKLRKSFDTQEEANRAVTQAIGGRNLNLNSGYGATLLGKVNSYADDISLASSEGTSSPNQSAALAPNAPSSTGLNMPSVGTLAAAAPTMGAMIEAATSEFTGALRLFDSALASITNITNNNTQSSSAGQQSQGNLPSVYDDVFLNLFQRVT